MVRCLVLDPSGNFNEGDGTTGWALFLDGKLGDFGHVKSSDYTVAEAYWKAVLDVVYRISPDKIVCESFKLFGHKAKQQSWSEMETPQLIGALRLRCFEQGISLVFQNPSDKVRVTDPILVHMGVLEEKNGRYYALGRPTVIHSRDAIRHGVYFHRYGAKNDKLGAANGQK